MKKIGITQRVIFKDGKTLDRLDYEWHDFLVKCKLPYQLISNDPNKISLSFINNFAGIILTGGNSLISCGGDSFLRDVTEKKIYRFALKINIPLIGVCRGMQIIQEMNGIKIQKVFGHVKKKQRVLINKKNIFTNSYHNYGSRFNSSCFKVFAKTDDGVIKGIANNNKKVFGIMWHPERNKYYSNFDIQFFKKIFIR